VKFENRDTSNTPDIEFTADVRARELHFETAPNPKVHFHGNPERNSDWLSKRENLPDEVREGKVYRNAKVQLLIANETTNSHRNFLNR
jgi:hypothetical protein